MRRRLRLPEERPEPRAAFRIDGTDARRNIRLPPPPGIQTPIERARSVGVCAIRILHQWRITAVTKAICEERVERQCPRGLPRFEIRSAAGPSTRMRGSARRLPIIPYSRSGL